MRKKYATLPEVAEYLDWLYGDKDKIWAIENIGTLVRASTELILMVGDHRAAHPAPIVVKDAPTQGKFVRNAIIAYKKAHATDFRRGRTSEENACMVKLMALSHDLGRDPTYSEMVTTLMETKLDILKVSKNTAHKYARLYRLWLQESQELSTPDEKWLRRNFGAGSHPVLWLGFRAGQWIEAAQSSRLRHNIKQVYRRHLSRQREILEARRLDFLKHS